MTENSAFLEKWPDLAGRLEGREHVLPLRVYYEDTDFSGFVYHANYLKFCERGRSDFLRLCGIHHGEMSRESGAGFVVRHMECDFLKPAMIDDVLEVRSRFLGLRGARMEIGQRILCGTQVLFAAHVTAVLIDARGRPLRFPSSLREKMEPLLWPEGG